MKIVFVLEHFYPYVGGAEELFFSLATGLTKLNHSVIVITTKHDSSLLSHENILGVDVVRVNCINRYLFTFLGIPSVLKFVGDADLIHTTSYNSAIPAYLAGLIRKKKVIITFHEVWGPLWHKLPFLSKWKAYLFHTFERIILNLPFYKYVAVSENTRKALEDHGIEKSRIEVIYNGISYGRMEEFTHLPPDNFTVCYFGRLGISKGLDILIKGSALFFSEHPFARLKLIIPTYPKNIFRMVNNLIEQHDIRDNVILLHDLTKEDLFNEICHSSCVIIPSFSEGFCYVAVESAAMGIPIITSGKGALREVVSGRYIEISDLNAKGIYQALIRGLNENWGFEKSRKFNLNTSINRYIALYEHIGLIND